MLPLLFLLITAVSSVGFFQNTPTRRYSWHKDLSFQVAKTTKRLK